MGRTFNSLLNVEAVIDLDVIAKLVQRPIIFELDQDIKLCEVKFALKQTKNAKYPEEMEFLLIFGNRAEILFT